jgi:hypothetical protein
VVVKVSGADQGKARIDPQGVGRAGSTGVGQIENKMSKISISR